MYTDSVLKEKERVQKKLSREAGYDVNKLFENMHKGATALAKEANKTLKYSKRKGGYIDNFFLNQQGISHSWKTIT